jgi:hypothetical protein
MGSGWLPQHHTSNIRPMTQTLFREDAYLFECSATVIAVQAWGA